jgi:hypothetical protein
LNSLKTAAFIFMFDPPRMSEVGQEGLAHNGIPYVPCFL